jgi:UDP-N-acetylglucosamine--N-acetylmuramyl-(pentapeptide) pyrophosphoryl-undecaprenol N-acetylglucosamine transferase
MKEAYGAADLVICRAGALTVAELTSAGLGAILIPYPHAIDDHQTANAKWLVDRGGALLYQQADLNAEALSALIGELISDPKTCMAMAIAARSLGQSRAAETVADACMEYFHAAT